jgi:DNA-binding transcriptional regulator YiaG
VELSATVAVQMVELESLRLRARAQRELPDPRRAKALRHAAGVSLQELADAVGVSQRAIAYWESGKRRPRGPQLERYVEAINALASELGASP